MNKRDFHKEMDKRKAREKRNAQMQAAMIEAFPDVVFRNEEFEAALRVVDEELGEEDPRSELL